MQVEDKFTSVSIRQYGDEKWRAQLMYKDEEGNWRKTSRVLETTGRDTGRSKQVWKAASYEAEEL